jgi:hypothetical protein
VALRTKVLRSFLVAFAGAFLTTCPPIADQMANGTHVDFSLLGSILLGAIAGVFAAAIRAVTAFLPLFVEDNEFGMSKRPT